MGFRFWCRAAFAALVGNFAAIVLFLLCVFALATCNGCGWDASVTREPDGGVTVEVGGSSDK